MSEVDCLNMLSKQLNIIRKFQYEVGAPILSEFLWRKGIVGVLYLIIKNLL